MDSEIGMKETNWFGCDEANVKEADSNETCEMSLRVDSREEMSD